ncbi:Na+/H+ antiporter [Cytophagales bacterium WSM2-2]|nr:Na+/H+ antiporter [Cytophagales bacterium WSM2-2]
MQSVFIQYVFLILIILGLVMIANRLRIAYPIVLVLGGLVLSLASPFSNITIDPDLIFFIFLPPLLYEAAWQTSWKEFWRWKRVIMSFAFPIVILTSCVVAVSSYAIIPGFTLALGFLLGGIVSPPDAISASTIMRQVNAPRILVNVSEGESLLNDASSLIVFRFALVAVITGQFSFSQAAGSFFLVIVMGTLIGVATGLVFYAIHRWLPTTPSIEIVLSFIAPYCMYYFAERFHFSGVLAVVAGGLLLSSQRQKMLTYQGRVQGANVWSTIGFVLNGVVFLLIGLQLPSITSQVEEVSIAQAIGYGLAISLVLIIARMLSTLGAAQFTRFMANFITVAQRNPGWKIPVIFGWSGMRGVVSLAAALSIPVLAEGHPFPYRNLILFITFIVILVTLVVQGLTLPWLIRTLKPENRLETMTEHEQEVIIQKKIAHISVKYLDEKYVKELGGNEHFNNLYSRLKIDLAYFSQGHESIRHTDRNSPGNFQRIYLEVLEQQRAMLNKINHNLEFDEELIRKYLSLIDMEEFKIREKLLPDSQ